MRGVLPLWRKTGRQSALALSCDLLEVAMGAVPRCLPFVPVDGGQAPFDEALDAALKTASRHQDIALARKAFDADVQAYTQDTPYPTPAGVCLAQLHDISDR